MIKECKTARFFYEPTVQQRYIALQYARIQETERLVSWLCRKLRTKGVSLNLCPYLAWDGEKEEMLSMYVAVHLRHYHGQQMHNEAFFNNIPINWADRPNKFWGYLWPNYQHPFWHYESLVHDFHHSVVFSTNPNIFQI